MDCTEPKIELTGPDCDGFYRWREWVIARGVTSNRWVIRTAGGKYLAGSYDTPEAAARALAERGYGPGAKAEAAPEGPRWEHHQPDTYLGRHGEFDLYFSTAALSIGDMFPPPYVYARFGSDAGAHWWAQAVPTETIVDPAPHVQTARRLARERGLLPEPLPALPDGYDAAKIPVGMEWTGEVRPPKQGEWLLLCKESGGRAFQASYDWTGYGSPILRHKPLPPTRATLSYRDAWPTPRAADLESKKETPMPPKDEAAPQGRALTTEEFDQMVELAKTFRCDDGPAWDAPVNALEAHARWLHFQVDPSATFDEPAPAPTPTPSAYVQTLQPIPGAFARFASAAGVAVVTALATIAGLFGGVSLAVKFHLIG